MSDRLRDELIRIGEQVLLVDLEERVLLTARRMVLRRTAVTCVAAVVVVSVVVWGAAALHRSGRAAPLPATTGTPVPSAAPQVAAGCAATPAPATVDLRFPGTLYLLSRGETCVRLFTISDGTLRLRISVDGQHIGCTQNSLTVSPDGERVAWVANDDDSSLAGDLFVADLDGSASAGWVVASQVTCAGGLGPGWQPDSRHVLVHQVETRKALLVDARTATTKAAPGRDAGQAYEVWSLNGAYRAYRVGDLRIEVARADGAVVQAMTYNGDQGPCGCGISVQGVSDDGRYVIAGQGNTDPSRVVGGTWLVDLVAGHVGVPESVGAGPVSMQMLFAAAQQRIMLSDRQPGPGAVLGVYLVSDAGAGTLQGTLPGGFDGQVLAYRL